ncbi:MAG: TVP38/TMEM64 family protein [Aerococcus sp.]|nr:TVP38/TMEM64 family protein [Aerococcus sp.]
MELTKKQQKIVQIGLFLVVVAIGAFFFRGMDIETIRQTVVDSGPLGIVIFELMWIFLPIFLFPVLVLAIVGGIGYGLWFGAFLVLIGASLNMCTMFWISRYLARDLVREYISNHHPKLFRWLYQQTDKLPQTIFILRILPAISYNLINYVSGLTDIKTRDFLLASILGIMPGGLAYVNIGDKALDPTSPEFFRSLLYFGAFVVITSIGVYFWKKRQGKQAE